ncbi:QWRF motif-containing protein 9-like isoform X3 [Juglans microcarpa x Juglans regia]|uniref:QWRF motif-containing protein 9-like isoform X3 n=1 Tax=Juglans microcarpa x Juglans regia TaxID=2249226 RepID=UPI001B7E1DDB|nr:QWRF motif-containing protein 9-like isoform X3 [Juglans microcarpa x Juglans regia]XP_041021958.1 QWRF motif-containing protein 9-like isoform X3 [Juglans microcarpa x Juglans regia]XP_041021959.1 QWRF motif-containing protein 9-like isoform X3 [Juglans microcarpa x Juglans regia]
MSGKGEDYETCSYEEVVNMTYLEEWALKDWDYFSSLLGATEALKASTLRLPVVGGAKVSANVSAAQKLSCNGILNLFIVIEGWGSELFGF